MGTIVKAPIGTEDLKLKDSGTSRATFTRTDSNSRTLTLSKIDGGDIQFRTLAKTLDDLVDGGFDVIVKADIRFQTLSTSLDDLVDGGHDVIIKPADVITKKPWIDSRFYADLDAAIADIGATEIDLYVTSAFTVSANAVVPATMRLVFLQGGSLNNGASTVTINGSLSSGLYKIFDGAGAITMGSLVSAVHPEWWGITGANDEAQIDLAEASISTGGTIILSQDYAIDDDITIAVGVTAEFKNGSKFTVANAKTATFGGQIKAGYYTIFAGTGVVVFSTAIRGKADWWDKSSAGAALNAAYTALTAGSTLLLSGGTWACGTTSVVFTETKSLHVIGTGYEKGNGSTNITFTTTGTFQITYYSTLEGVWISGSQYGLTIGDHGGSPASFNGTIREVHVSGCSIAGIRAEGLQLCHLERVTSLGNTGAGMLVDGESNTHATFDTCRFSENGEEGILYTETPASNFSGFNYISCVIESNQKEGVKNEIGVLKNTTFTDCHCENNNLGGAASDYDFYLNNVGNLNVVIRTTRMAQSTATITPVGFKGELVIVDNFWSGTFPWIDCLDGGGTGRLVNKDRNVRFGETITTWTDTRNEAINASGKNDVISYTSNTLLQRYKGGVSIDNTGASGTIVLTLAAASIDQEVTISVSAAFQIDITPGSGDKILITAAAAADQVVRNTGTIGESITLRAVDNVNWVIQAIHGTWSLV